MQPIATKKIDISEVENLQKIGIQTFIETFEEVNAEEDMQKYIAESLSISQLTSELQNPNSEFYFASKDEQIVGYLKVNFADAQTENVNQNSLEIERIYVLKEFLGLKIGQLLFDRAVEIGKERMVEFVWLGVWEKNGRAIRFYEKNGFEIFGKHDFVLGNDVQTDLMMKLEI